MMLPIAIINLLLLVPSVPAHTGTTIPVIDPAVGCCDDFTMEPEYSPAEPLLPTDVAIVKASCTCNTENGPSCPVISVAKEAQRQITLDANTKILNQSCVLTASIAVQSQFTRRSIVVPLICHGFNKTRHITFRFEKSSDKGKCKEDVDCWYSQEQICNESMCSCYSDKPSFVMEQEKCYTASGHGEKCLYDEQCMSEDINTVCVDNKCACRESYWVTSRDNPVCTPFPAGDCCDDFTVEPATSPSDTILPTDAAIVKASCTCKAKTGLACPTIVIAEEAVEQITFAGNYVITNNSCYLTAAIRAVLNRFTKRSIEVPLTFNGFNTTRQITFRFEKNSDKGKCKEDVDCWYSQEQICNKSMCSCYSDKPSFVMEQEKCYTASGYGEKCLYDEQCKYEDANTICMDNKCACRENYWVTSGDNPLCIPPGDCCDNFTMEPATSPADPLLPTDAAIVKASCTCKTKTGLSCPIINTSDEAQGHITLAASYVITNQSCNLTATVTAIQSQFTKRSFEAPLTCNTFNTTRQITFRFEKSSDKAKCNEDVDCWYSKEQICNNNMCSCYSDKPSFVVEEEKCYTASGYGEKCLYDEQCWSKDGNTVCVDSKCTCRKNYKVKSDKNLVCTTSLSSKLIPSQFLILGVAVSSITYLVFLK